MSGAFAKTTFGPPAPGTTDTNKGALIADVQTPAVEMVDMQGNTHGMRSTLLLLQAQTALSTITTAQTLFSLAFLKGALNKTNRTLRVIGTIIFTVGTGTPTTTIVLKLGSVTLATIVTAALQAVTNGQLVFDFVISVATSGSSGTLEVHGSVKAQLGATNPLAIAEYLDVNTAASSAVDLTAAETLTATIAASTTMSAAQLRQALVELVN